MRTFGLSKHRQPLGLAWSLALSTVSVVEPSSEIRPPASGTDSNTPSSLMSQCVSLLLIARISECLHYIALLLTFTAADLMIIEVIFGCIRLQSSAGLRAVTPHVFSVCVQPAKANCRTNLKHSLSWALEILQIIILATIVGRSFTSLMILCPSRSAGVALPRLHNWA